MALNPLLSFPIDGIGGSAGGLAAFEPFFFRMHPCMAFLNGILQPLGPTAPRGQCLPIDFFFRCIAQDQREPAIGIVLSGTGSDGTQGREPSRGVR